MPTSTVSANVGFHKQVRQNGGTWKMDPSHRHDMNMNPGPRPDDHEGVNGARDSEAQPSHEYTPLLSGDQANGRRDAAYHFFLDTKFTPGADSPNPFVKWPAHVWHVTKITLLSSYVNFLLLFVPVGIVAGALGWPSTWVFSLNFLAIIPLAAVLSFATEEISVRLGETLGGLLNATFGNAVELIVSCPLHQPSSTPTCRSMKADTLRKGQHCSAS
jgi:Ca2+:H+ antiporter